MFACKTFLATAAAVLMAGSVQAATMTFDIRAEVSHVTNNVEADVASGDMMRVRGSFDTDSLRDSRIANRMSFLDVFDVNISGPVMGDHDDFEVSLVEIRDNEERTGTDLFRLIIDFYNGPAVNDTTYDMVRLSFYIPMALSTLDAATFLSLEDAIYPELVPTSTGRTAVMSAAWRFPTSQDGRNAGFRGEVTSLRIAPVPLPAGGVMLLGVIVLGGLYARRRQQAA